MRLTKNIKKANYSFLSSSYLNNYINLVKYLDSKDTKNKNQLNRKFGSFIQF